VPEVSKSDDGIALKEFPLKKKFPPEKADKNSILMGMPGAGKSTRVVIAKPSGMILSILIV
jgi:hypothetical protein